MRIAIPAQPQSADIPADAAGKAAGAFFPCPLPVPSLAIAAGALVLILAGMLLHGQTSAAQTPAPAPPLTHKTAHPHKRPSAAHPVVTPTPAASEPVKPPEPVRPNWPAFDKPSDASVVWDSHGLRIDASNSSLEQIMKDVSTATGVKVDGLSSDQRVFGQYGPGQARDVLSQLLQGSGYNVLMIGDQGQGAPRQILLSVRQAGAAQPAGRQTSTQSSDEDEAEEPPVAEPVGPVRPGFAPGTPPRTPQQIMQEMQQRQQQQEQRGQPPQPNNPQN